MHIFQKISFPINCLWACVDFFKAICRSIEPQICRADHLVNTEQVRDTAQSRFNDVKDTTKLTFQLFYGHEHKQEDKDEHRNGQGQGQRHRNRHGQGLYANLYLLLVYVDKIKPSNSSPFPFMKSSDNSNICELYKMKISSYFNLPGVSCLLAYMQEYTYIR